MNRAPRPKTSSRPHHRPLKQPASEIRLAKWRRQAGRILAAHHTLMLRDGDLVIPNNPAPADGGEAA